MVDVLNLDPARGTRARVVISATMRNPHGLRGRRKQHDAESGSRSGRAEEVASGKNAMSRSGIAEARRNGVNRILTRKRGDASPFPSQ
jgi:hypothetical protein